MTNGQWLMSLNKGCTHQVSVPLILSKIMKKIDFLSYL